MMETRVAAEECTSIASAGVFETHRSRETALGPLLIWRALPVRDRRLVGPWCFLDRYGPLSFTDQKPMDVAPHPHIGLQTVSWLLEGEVIHHDSLGLEAIVRPGGVNVMTAGRGIAHSEETPRANTGTLNGVQLWIALPEGERNLEPSFQHIAEVPLVEMRGGVVQVFAGRLADDATSQARAYSDLIGAGLEIHSGERLELPVDVAREHALFLFDGDAEMDGNALEVNRLSYLGTGRSVLPLASKQGARLLLVGGIPFEEPVLMWWNFVARTPEEIIAAREAWQERRGFGEVAAYAGSRIEAPPLTRIARPNPAS
jgi:quercetin 2,3-dioxygenase